MHYLTSTYISTYGHILSAFGKVIGDWKIDNTSCRLIPTGIWKLYLCYPFGIAILSFSCDMLFCDRWQSFLCGFCNWKPGRGMDLGVCYHVSSCVWPGVPRTPIFETCDFVSTTLHVNKAQFRRHFYVSFVSIASALDMPDFSMILEKQNNLRPAWAS